MSVQYDATPRTGNDNTGVVLSTAAALGSVAVRVAIDDTVVTSKGEALRTLLSVRNLVQKGDWPDTVVVPGIDWFPLLLQSNRIGRNGPIDPLLDATDDRIVQYGFDAQTITIAADPLDHQE